MYQLCMLFHLLSSEGKSLKGPTEFYFMLSKLGGFRLYAVFYKRRKTDNITFGFVSADLV